MTGEKTSETVKGMVVRLMDECGMSADEISTALQKRVSRRTVYRWRKGESEPQQPSDLVELNKLYRQRCSA